jgi:broad specificity phosphatase PhoE
MRLILTRHGETIENKEGIIQGHLPGKLSEEGIGQAKKVALRLKDEKIDFAFSSDLARSSDTAKEIMKFHKNIPIQFTKELRERFLGEIQGKKRSELGFGEQKYVAGNDNIKGAETLEQLFKRAESFLDKVLQKHHNDTVLFVGHNGINKALIAAISGKAYEDIPNVENQKNTSINIFEIEQDKSHKIHCLNCVKHLG